MLLTLDRFELTKEIFEKNFKRAMDFASAAEEQIEILVCDNGSLDRRIVDYFAGLNIKYHRINSKNEGISMAFNQLYLRSTGDILCFLGNDIEMPKDWLCEAVNYLAVVPNAGIMGFDWGYSGVSQPSNRFGVNARWTKDVNDRVFGSWVMKRNVVEQIGLFHEGYDVYGMEDSDMNLRANIAGFNSFYHPTLQSIHHVNDVGLKTDYRRMKDESLVKNSLLFEQRVEAFKRFEVIEPLPEMRGPL